MEQIYSISIKPKESIKTIKLINKIFSLKGLSKRRNTAKQYRPTPY